MLLVAARITRFTRPLSTLILFNFRLFLVSLQNSAQDVFSDDVIFENSQGPISFNTDHIYSGFLEGNIGNFI